MEKLNNQIIKLLKEHKEGGEKFFDALDLMIRSDYSILDTMVQKIIKYYHKDVLKSSDQENLDMLFTIIINTF